MNTTVHAALAVAIFFGCAAEPTIATPAADRPVINIAQGALAGRVDAQGVTSFKGIPFAEPPVGNRRWAAPGAAPGWKGVRDAGRFGANCIQPPWPRKIIYNDGLSNFSED